MEFMQLIITLLIYFKNVIMKFLTSFFFGLSVIKYKIKEGFF